VKSFDKISTIDDKGMLDAAGVQHIQGHAYTLQDVGVGHVDPAPKHGLGYALRMWLEFENFNWNYCTLESPSMSDKPIIQGTSRVAPHILYPPREWLGVCHVADQESTSIVMRIECEVL
jgi:hypothetical protein